MTAIRKMAPADLDDLVRSHLREARADPVFAKGRMPDHQLKRILETISDEGYVSDAFYFFQNEGNEKRSRCYQFPDDDGHTVVFEVIDTKPDVPRDDRYFANIFICHQGNRWEYQLTLDLLREV